MTWPPSAASVPASWPPGTPMKISSTGWPWPAPRPTVAPSPSGGTDFYTRCADSGLPELHRLATAVETWWPQILAFIHTGITNAGSEGTNRVIKTIARDAYGFRNPENQRLRTRTAT